MISIPLEPFYVWMMVFLRVGFVLFFFPVFGERFVPVRIRLVLAMVIAVALVPVSGLSVSDMPTSSSGLAIMVVSEALLGFSIGFVGRILFAIMQYAGQVAGEQMGFGMVNTLDPTGSHQISVIAELLYILSVLIFLATDMHHVFLRAIAHSWQQLPPGGAAFSAGLTGYMMQLGAVMFDFAVRLAMPVILLVFAVYISLGMIAKAVPQFNVFLESFPLRIMAGMAVLMVSLGFTMTVWGNLCGRMDHMILRVLEIFAG